MSSNLKICIYILTVLIYQILKTVAISNFPKSPCPEVFFYEDVSTDGDRWYGSITLRSERTVSGFTLRISLDRPAQLVASWEGNVISNDNKIFVVFDPVQKLMEKTSMTFRIMVKFDSKKQQIPFLQTIHFNGRKACPPDAPLTLSAGSFEATPGIRPDLDITEPYDVHSDWGTKDREQTATTSTRATVTVAPKVANSSTAVRCGQIDLVTPLITHGTPTYRGQWPWHAALYRTEGVNLNYKCGATIVSRTHLITAAHCVTNAQSRAVNPVSLVLYLGKYKLNQYSDEEGVQVKQVTRIHVHPEYNTNNYYGDIAILTLSTAIDYNTFVKPICVWEENSEISELVGQQGSVVGWGLDESDEATQDLRVASMPVVSSETCLRSFPQFYSQFTSNGSFCAGFLNGTSPCNGDSGGGLVFSRDSVWYLRGIVSLSVAKEGLNFCDPRYYVIFTDVTKFREFIDRFVVF